MLRKAVGGGCSQLVCEKQGTQSSGASAQKLPAGFAFQRSESSFVKESFDVHRSSVGKGFIEIQQDLRDDCSNVLRGLILDRFKESIQFLQSLGVSRSTRDKPVSLGELLFQGVCVFDNESLSELFCRIDKRFFVQSNKCLKGGVRCESTRIAKLP